MRTCETKPITRLRIAGTAPGNWRPPSAELSDWGLWIGTDLPHPPETGRLCRTKPMSACRPRLLRAKCAKQTQSGAPIVRNKPNFAGQPGPQRAKRAKQTQFPGGIPHRSTILLFHHSGPIRIVRNKANPKSPSRKTNPIPACRSPEAPRVRGVGCCTNKPNSSHAR